MAFRQYDAEARQGSVRDERALCNRTSPLFGFPTNTTQKHAKVVSEQLRPAVNRLETQLVGSEAQGRGFSLFWCDVDCHTNLARLRSISNGSGRGW